MASGLFGSGPQSNILNTVQSSYTGMLNAEIQKGKGVSAALGAFGEAISPKSIGMRQFKKDFAEADWNDPTTYMKAGQQIMKFDANGGLAMIQKGQALAASQAPKANWQQVTTTNADGSTTTKIVNVNDPNAQRTFESEAPPPTPSWQKVTTTNADGSTVTRIVNANDPDADNTFESEAPPPKPKMQAVTYTDENGNEITEIVDFNDPDVQRKFTSAPAPVQPTTLAKNIEMASGHEIGTKEHGQAMKEHMEKVDVVKNIDSPIKQTELIDNNISSDPEFKKAQSVRNTVNTGLKLLYSAKDVDSFNSKASSLLERIVSESFNADTRAATEIQRLVDRGSFSQKITDWVSTGFNGVPSLKTLDEYEELLYLMDDTMVRVSNSVVETQTGLYSPHVEENIITNINNNRMLKSKNTENTVDNLANGIYDFKGKTVRVFNGVVYDL